VFVQHFFAGLPARNCLNLLVRAPLARTKALVSGRFWVKSADLELSMSGEDIG